MSEVAPQVPLKTGTIKWFNFTRGYGFIIPEDGRGDVFAHATLFEKHQIWPKPDLPIQYRDMQTLVGRRATLLRAFPTH